MSLVINRFFRLCHVSLVATSGLKVCGNKCSWYGTQYGKMITQCLVAGRIVQYAFG